MKDAQIKQSDPNARRPWKRIAGKEIGQKLQQADQRFGQAEVPALTWVASLRKLRVIISSLFLNLVHRASRIANKPMVDIGREYSVSELNERIRTLEEVLVRQWTELKDSDYLTPSEEVKQYIAACHVSRQYDRITSQLLSARLGVSQNKAEQLIDQLLDDEVITESYTVTYHDVRKSMIDPTIEQKLSGLHQVSSGDAASPAKKH